MYFNDSDNKQNSLYHYALFLLGLANSDTTSFPIADFTRSCNAWFRRLVFLMWKNTYTWEFDDSSFSTLPIATTSMVANQQDYSLPTTALDIQRVEVKDSNGDWQIVKQLDKSEISDEAMTEFEETAGRPYYYDLIGGSLFLYPKPASGSVTLTSGLKLYLTRDINAFEEDDTTREPGIQSLFQPYLAYGPALDYAISKNLDVNKFTLLKTVVNDYEVGIQQHAERRNKDYKTKIRPKIRQSI